MDKAPFHILGVELVIKRRGNCSKKHNLLGAFIKSWHFLSVIIVLSFIFISLFFRVDFKTLNKADELGGNYQNKYSNESLIKDIKKTKLVPNNNKNNLFLFHENKHPPLLDFSNLSKEALNKSEDGNWEEAYSILQKILEIDPRNENVLVQFAMITLVNKNDAAAALSIMEKIIKLNPKNDTVLDQMTITYNELGKSQEGIILFKSILDEDASPNVERALARLILLQDPSENSVSDLQALVDSGEFKSPVVFEELGDYYIEKGNADKAMENYKKSLNMQDTLQKNNMASNTLNLNERSSLKILGYVSSLIQYGRYRDADDFLNKLDVKMPGDQWIREFRKEIRKNLKTFSCANYANKKC
ncbi:MAG: hypothetical protein HQK53_01085 [Oligoflexia bacterium]|nr:hypothetical protein [Oligoflexia bacterium]